MTAGIQHIRSRRSRLALTKLFHDRRCPGEHAGFLAAISTEIANNGGTSAAITNLDLMDGLSYQSAGKLDPAAKILRPNRRRIGPEFDRDLFAIGSLARHRRKRGQRLIALAHEIRSRPEQQMAKRGGSVQATG